MNNPLEDASHLYPVNERKTYAQREGFRVRELSLGPSQEVPWHMHTNISDTFYPLEGTLCIELRQPDQTVRLAPGKTLEVTPNRPHRVTADDGQLATFLILQGIGQYDYVPLD
jgi:quercetin dioxygenase-like cupin family protein